MEAHPRSDPMSEVAAPYRARHDTPDALTREAPGSK